MEMKIRADQYRDTAHELREMAQRAQSDEIRAELTALAERFERLGKHRRNSLAGVWMG
jgi:hypothetical protein